MCTDYRMWVAKAAKLSGLHFVRAGEVFARVPAFEGRWPGGADVRHGLGADGLVNQVLR